MSSGPTPVSSIARWAARPPRVREDPPMRRSRMPVRSVIHSSEVSSVLERSSLVTTRSGTAMPHPRKRTPMVKPPEGLPKSLGLRPPGGAGAATICSEHRAAQMRLPSSSVRSMDHTCTRRPLRSGVAVAVNVPLVIERRCEQLSSVPTATWSGQTLAVAPTDAALSASSAETPPCRRPKGWWVRGPTSTVITTRSGVTSTNSNAEVVVDAGAPREVAQGVVAHRGESTGPVASLHDATGRPAQRHPHAADRRDARGDVRRRGRRRRRARGPDGQPPRGALRADRRQARGGLRALGGHGQPDRAAGADAPGRRRHLGTPRPRRALRDGRRRAQRVDPVHAAVDGRRRAARRRRARGPRRRARPPRPRVAGDRGEHPHVRRRHGLPDRAASHALGGGRPADPHGRRAAVQRRGGERRGRRRVRAVRDDGVVVPVQGPRRAGGFAAGGADRPHGARRASSASASAARCARPASSPRPGSSR